jgi:hypothetical protein
MGIWLATATLLTLPALLATLPRLLAAG